jgi:hypothetical protein
MYEIIFRPQMIIKWTQLLKIETRYQQNCDWNLFFRSLNGQTTSTRVNLIKDMARLLPVGTNLKRRRHATTNECPHCRAEETHGHLLSCTHPDMKQAFDETIDALKDSLRSITSPSMGRDILDIVLFYHSTDNHGSQNDQFNDRVQEQIQLGQNAFFAGVWTKRWCQDQHQFHESSGSKRDPTKWTAHIINKIQKVPLNMWAKRNAIRSADQKSNEVELQHLALNIEIESIYEKKPHGRMMTPCDNLYFTKHGKDQVKRMKLHRKINWVEGAKLLLVKYDRLDTEQAARFTSYFQWDRG